jgi:hypothetical protein
MWKLLKRVSRSWRQSLKPIGGSLSVLMEWWVLLFKTAPLLASHDLIVVAVKVYVNVKQGLPLKLVDLTVICYKCI